MSVLQNAYRNVFFTLILTFAPLFAFCNDCSQLYSQSIFQNSCNEKVSGYENSNLSKLKICKKQKKLSYYLYTEEFIKSFIEIPTSNVLVDSSTISSKYLAGRAAIYNEKNEKVGTCSASFLCIQNTDGIYTDISNYLSVDNGLVVSWFTPTTLINLELDSIVHSMVTECIVKASTKIGVNPFYGKTFNMIVSSDSGKIYFKLTKI